MMNAMKVATRTIESEAELRRIPPPVEAAIRKTSNIYLWGNPAGNYIYGILTGPSEKLPAKTS